MKIKEAIEVLKHMDQNKEVTLVFGEAIRNHDYSDRPDAYRPTRSNSNSQFADH